MVKPDSFGFDQPEFVTAENEEKTYADLIAASEKDMLHWLKNAVFAKTTTKDRGSLSDINDRSVLIVREPKIGIRRACYVETGSFLNEAHNYVVIIGSSRSMGVKLRS